MKLRRSLVEKDRFVSVWAGDGMREILHLVDVPVWVRRGLRFIGFIGLGFLGFLFLPWTQNIAAGGRVTSLTPEVRPQTLHAMIPGRLAHWYVREGVRVKAGDTLLQIAEIKDYYLDPALVERLREQIIAKEEALEAQQRKAVALRDQIRAIAAARDAALARARNALTQAQFRYKADSAAFLAAEVDLSVAQSQYQRQESLYVKGLRSLTDLQNRQAKYQEAQAKYIAARNRLGIARADVENAYLSIQALAADYQEKLAKAQSDLEATLAYVYDLQATIAKLRNELANVQVRRGFYYIVAPQDGYVVRAVKTGVGEVIKEGEPLAVFMPAGYQLAAEVYVKPMDVPLLRVGATVRLQFDGWPAFIFSGWPGLSFGTFSGCITAIDYVDDGSGSFRVLVQLDSTDAWPSLLRLGGGVRAWFLLNDVPIWYELWRQINGFPPDFLPQFYQAKTHQNSK